MTPAESLIPRWLGRAEGLRRYGVDERAAALWKLAAAELAEATRLWQDELLDLRQAAAESGYSPDHLGRLLRNGGLPNAGRKHAPRLRRGSLPRKARRAPPVVALEPPRVNISDRLFRDITTSKFGE